MEGGARYELVSGSPDSNFTGNYQNGQRGYSVPALGRSSSLRECSETRKFGSAKLNSRASANSSRDVPILTQCLMLEPISIGDSKFIRPGDLKRVFASSAGNNSEDSSFGSSYLRNSSPMAVEELKRFRANVADTCVKASGRAKNLDERLSKLNKYCETLPLKRQQLRGDILSNERSSGPVLKIGSQMHRNPPEANPKLDDRTRNIGLSKRVRTSMTENRGECRNSSMLRQPPMVTKDREVVKDNNVDSDVGEEKMRRLPAGGEGWDKNMKRKRSVGAVFSRSVDNDGELKRAVHSKPSSESSMQSSDSTHMFRSVASSASNKLETLATQTGSTTRVTFKSDQEKPIISREPSGGQIKDRPMGKVSVKLNREENHTMCPTLPVKGKASRGPRSGSITATNSSASVPRLSGTLESWEQPQGSMKASPVNGVSNKKRGMNAGSPSPPFTPWGSQRPQKISRTRRTNLGPVSNHDELPMQSDVCFTSESGPRISIGVGTNASPFSKTCDNASQILKIKSENVPSPARYSESDDSGAGENRSLEKGLGARDLEESTANPSHYIGPSSVSIRQNAAMLKEEVGDGVKRQGRSGRISPFSRSRISPKQEKLDNVVSTKPLQTVKSGDKSGSKSGRPLKKLSDRKGFGHLGNMANGGSPDYSGESDDDREELLAAANLACSSSITVCSSKFWKSVEALFGPLRPDDKAFLSEQMKLAEQPDAGSFQKLGNTGSVGMNLVDCGLEELAASNSVHQNRYMRNESEVKNASRQMDSLNGCSPAEKRYDVVAPLYQRVLSALILEDEIEECEETGFGRPRSLVNEPNLFSSLDGRYTDGPEFLEDRSGIQTWMNGHARKVFPVAPSNICNGELKEGDGKYVRSGVEMLARPSQCDYIPQNLMDRNGGISSFGCIEEKLMYELHSIGLFVEAVPPLDDNEEKEVSQEISRLERLLHEQIGKKKVYLAKINSIVQERTDLERDPEQIAMDKHVELTYKKILSTRGSLAIKYGVAKVKKPLALSLARRTLARCAKYEDSGISCFSEPSLREIVYALPPHFTDFELFSGVDPTSVNDCGPMDVLQTNGSTMLSRGKKREVLLDDVGGGGVSRVSTALGIVGAKGKRSERDASNKNGIANPGRTQVGGSKGERRAKTKLKQRTAQLSASGGTLLPKFTDATTNSIYSSGSGSGESGNNSGCKKKDIRFMSSSNPPSVSSQQMKETVEFSNLPIPDLDGMADLGADHEIDATQDLTSWFNFDVDMPHDHDSVGLEIPMDDLSELNMF